MNRLFKVAALTGAALVTQAAQAAFNNNDLVLGFDSPTAANDYVIELGQASSILSQPSPVNLTGLFSLSTFNSTFTSLNGTSLGVVGGSSAFTGFNIYTTELRSGLGDPASPGSTAPSQITTASFLKTAVGDVSVMVGNLGLSAGQSTTVARGDANSFNNKVAPSSGTGSFYTDSGLNPLGTASGSVVFEDLWQQNGNGAFSYKGFFTLDLSGGTSQLLTFTTAPVPEPSTFGLLGSAGALALWLRRQFSRKS